MRRLESSWSCVRETRVALGRRQPSFVEAWNQWRKRQKVESKDNDQWKARFQSSIGDLPERKSCPQLYGDIETVLHIFCPCSKELALCPETRLNYLVQPVQVDTHNARVPSSSQVRNTQGSGTPRA